MSLLNIEVTEYTRTDGLKMSKIANGSWVIRKVFGPSWFLDPMSLTWHISTSEGFWFENYGMTFDLAMSLFPTVK